MGSVKVGGKVLLSGGAVLIRTAPVKPAGRDGGKVVDEKGKAEKAQRNGSFHFHIVFTQVSKIFRQRTWAKTSFRHETDD
jgi:hypothetical protein